ncbi:hypothetical protein BK131_00155 [Paenibacillus amylolyticus]|uniref:Nucleic acid-binding protein n=1 Tax=Paenibacillus amylolyticus TaxID=1451 RepID=A0A1R1C2V0_PAEAM|nr:zinc ribbon domain-containing protein [Paenibacillus amylolyticus]OMF16462.1 hypothetical protein BK131_00155 [Paenibacillus amylolyticus]
MSIEEMIERRFVCTKCRGTDCNIKEAPMSGAGLSKVFDIQHNHYLFVSCASCGYVEIFDPDVLKGKKQGQVGTILDILFGG